MSLLYESTLNVSLSFPADELSKSLKMPRQRRPGAVSADLLWGQGLGRQWPPRWLAAAGDSGGPRGCRPVAAGGGFKTPRIAAPSRHASVLVAGGPSGIRDGLWLDSSARTRPDVS